MILPQGKIFNMLKSRLEVAKLVGHAEQPPAMGEAEIDVEFCLAEYRESQATFPKG
jgi:hypothetical protein